MMTQSWSSRFWKLGLVSSLAISGVVTSPGSWAFESSGDRAFLGTECSGNTPDGFINSLSIDQVDDTVAIAGTNYLLLAEALDGASSLSSELQRYGVSEYETVLVEFRSGVTGLGGITPVRCPCRPGVKWCCLG